MTHNTFCDCFDQHYITQWTDVSFHPEEQDTECEAWQKLLKLIDDAAVKQSTEFAPFKSLSWEERTQIIALPSTISRLSSVKVLDLYRSLLVRIPPEIGDMSNLEEFIPYTSHSLHWFPYEITRCTKLHKSTVSTRSLYGNFKLRPPFPRLQPGRNSTSDLTLDALSPGIWGASAIQKCSICNTSLTYTGLHQVWISLRVGSDIVPLLVNACSEACVQKLPQPPENYVQFPHTGGLEIKQPRAYDDF